MRRLTLGLVVLFGTLCTMGCPGGPHPAQLEQKAPPSEAERQEPEPQEQEPQEITTATGLRYTDIKEGEGASAQPDRWVSVHYTGLLPDGKKFDSSHDAGKPFTFRLGAGQVIRGWDEGIASMKVGGKRQLVIPPELGYGERGAGEIIPPNTQLRFDVELVEVSTQAPKKDRQ